VARDDDRFGEDVREAYGRDLPDESFTDAVLDRLDGGRVREMSLPAPRGPRGVRWVVAALAAAVLVVAVLRLWPREDEPEATAGPESGGVVHAGPEDDDPLPPVEEEEEVIEDPVIRDEPVKPVELPRAEKAISQPADLVIEILAGGEVVVESRIVDHEGLKRWLRARADAARKPDAKPHEPSELSVLIRADRRAGWRNVQWVMQACADPTVRIYKLQMAAGTGSIGTHLPRDRGLRAGPPKAVPAARLVLRRFSDHPETTVSFAGRGLGRGEAAFRLLRTRVSESQTIMRERMEQDLAVTIDAGANVPHAEVVLAIDACLAAGIPNVTFVGTPPPKPRDQIRESPILRDVPIREDVTIRMQLARVDGRTMAFFNRPDPKPLGETVEFLKGLVRRAGAGGGRVSAQIEAPTDVPWKDMAVVLEALWNAGVREIRTRVQE
jgi:biopolymer transport protein ExbD